MTDRNPPDPAAGAPRRRRGEPAGAFLPDASGTAGTSPSPEVPAQTLRRAGSPTPRSGGARASSRAARRGQAPRRGTREEAPQAPAGRVSEPLEGNERAPAGPRRLRGAEALKAIQQAQAKARRGPAVRKPAVRTTAPPVAASGASLTATATCLSGCGWTEGPGDPAAVDKAAARHTEKPPRHATSQFSVPVAARTARSGGA